MTMGTRIRQLRKLHHLTQAQLGEMCNATKSAVSQWESDQTLPTLANILALHERLSFSLDWLLVGDGDPNDQSANMALKLIYNSLDQRGRDAVLRVAQSEDTYAAKASAQ